MIDIAAARRRLSARLPHRDDPPTNRYEWAQYRREARRHDDIGAMHDRVADRDDTGGIGRDGGECLYALVRATRPELVVETGVANGVSTTYLLAALNANAAGCLVSIDYPYHAGDDLDAFRRETFPGYGGAAIPDDKRPGWAVPETYRDRWELRIGKSQRVLPDVLDEAGAIDCFVHDSEHSAACQLMEFELAWERLATGGVLVADDWEWTPAWRLFVAERQPANSGRVGPLRYAMRGERDE